MKYILTEKPVTTEHHIGSWLLTRTKSQAFVSYHGAQRFSSSKISYFYQHPLNIRSTTNGPSFSSHKESARSNSLFSSY